MSCKEQESCKNCIYLKVVMCHPTNAEKDPNAPWWHQDRCQIGKGPINQQFGWVCTVPEMPYYMFLDKDTGMCECHTTLEEYTNLTK